MALLIVSEVQPGGFAHGPLEKRGFAGRVAGFEIVICSSFQMHAPRWGGVSRSLDGTVGPANPEEGFGVSDAGQSGMSKSVCGFAPASRSNILKPISFMTFDRFDQKSC